MEQQQQVQNNIEMEQEHEIQINDTSKTITKDAVEAQKDPAEAQKDPAFYTDAAAYWDSVEPTVDGVLGGYQSVSCTDINGSESFIKSIFKMTNSPGHVRAIDCGAGIGRITKCLLQKHFGKVDLLEPCKNFIDKAKENFSNSKKIGEFYCIGLQDFNPDPLTYDVIWIQWVLSHLNDKDLEKFFKRIIPSLKPNGVIVLKENLSGSGVVEFDEVDSSITRPEASLLSIIDLAGLHVVKNIRQRNLPKGLFEVRMFCLIPKSNNEMESL